MAICEGPIAGVLKAFDDKDQTDYVMDNFTATARLHARHDDVAHSSAGADRRNVSSRLSPGRGSRSLASSDPSSTSPRRSRSARRCRRPHTSRRHSRARLRDVPGDAVAGSVELPHHELSRGGRSLRAHGLHGEPGGPRRTSSSELFVGSAGAPPVGLGIVDSNPKDIISDFLTDANHGVGFPSALIASLTTSATTARPPASSSRRSSTRSGRPRSISRSCWRVANSAFVWSDGTLKIVPYGDQRSPGMASLHANVTPLYNLTDDDFIAGEGEDPVRVYGGRSPTSTTWCRSSSTTAPTSTTAT
jgi:hypothetical protein